MSPRAARETLHSPVCPSDTEKVGGVPYEAANESEGCGPLHEEEDYSDPDYYDLDYVEQLAVEGDFDPSDVKQRVSEITNRTTQASLRQ